MESIRSSYTPSLSKTPPRSHPTHTHQPSTQPLCQSFRGGVGDLAPQVVPLIVVHELQRPPQVLQQVQNPEAAQEGRGGRLAVKEPVGVIHGLGACREHRVRVRMTQEAHLQVQGSS